MIPQSAAKYIADQYNYDQVIIVGRSAGRNQVIVSYGRGETNRGLVSRLALYVKFSLDQWSRGE